MGPTSWFLFSKAYLATSECSSCQQERLTLSITPQGVNKPLHIKLCSFHPGRASGSLTQQ